MAPAKTIPMGDNLESNRSVRGTRSKMLFPAHYNHSLSLPLALRIRRKPPSQKEGPSSGKAARRKFHFPHKASQTHPKPSPKMKTNLFWLCTCCHLVVLLSTVGECALPYIYDTSWFADYSPPNVDGDVLRPPLRSEKDFAFTASEGGAVPKEPYR